MYIIYSILIFFMITILIYINHNINKYMRLVRGYDNLKIYIINLDRSKDRYNHIKHQLKKREINNCIRFSGIDGSKYKLNNYEKSLFKNADFKYNKALGITGCALSHYYMWKKIVTNNIKECIILEDDIIFDENFNKEKIKLLKYKSNYDLIFLYHTIDTHNPYIKNKNSYIIPYKKKKWYGCGAVSYYINNKAASYLFNYVSKNGFNRAVDWVIIEQINKIKIGILKKSIISHRNDTNSVIAENNAHF